MADWESFRKNHYELLGNAIVKNLDKRATVPNTWQLRKVQKER